MTVTIRLPPHCAFTIPEAQRGLLAVVLVLYQALTRVVLEVLQLWSINICTKTCAFVLLTHHPSPLTMHAGVGVGVGVRRIILAVRALAVICIVPAAAHVSAISRGCHLPVATHIIPEYCQHNHLT